ncbi:MAG: hypothetical protein CL912_11520 [Deltaproteobacteria bacterium]|nr:hypothetical protein [Deltaproteobacteria bacterium]
MFFFSIQLIRRAWYEWFLNSHLILSALVLIALWPHSSSQKSAGVFLLIGVGVWTVSTVIHWISFAYRNFVLGRPFATATVVNERLGDFLEVHVVVPRPWRVKPGQFIFLSIPKLGVFTGLRGHPFMISWWEYDQRGLMLSLLVRSRAGFTAELNRHVDKPLQAFIDGPYGLQHDFGEHETVIMFATGIGIAGCIPYIKDLLLGYNSCEIRTRRIRVAWELKEQCR